MPKASSLGAGKMPDAPKMARTVSLAAMTYGSVLFDADMARKVAQILLEAFYDDEAEKQQPLIVIDQGDCWRVEGSWNRDGKIQGEGEFYAVLWKYDGRVVDFGRNARITPPPEIQEMINRHYQKLIDEGRPLPDGAV